MASKRIVVVEDDPAIRRGVCDALEFHGYAVIQTGDAKNGRSAAVGADCDLVLLDLVLPGGDGLEILQAVRAARPTLPVIILTARGEEADRVAGLRGGADDYVVKPFSVNELLARVEAVLRRSADRPIDLQTIEFPGGVGDFPRREIRFTTGQRCELSEREAELLRCLAMRRGRAVSREEILQRVWRIDAGGAETRAIDMHIARLREKMRDDAADPKIILTVRNKGYMLAAAREQ